LASHSYQVPELGGATTFTKADIFVRPVPLSATFFTYMGLDGRVDTGYTEHSGCPIRQGEKWIATAWMREGVSLEHPSTMYDPSGFLNLPESLEEDTSVEQEMVQTEVSYEGM
jgi:hypothetical protein